MKYYIALQLVLGAGNARVNNIISYFGNAKAVFSANKNELLQCGFFSKSELKKIENIDFKKSENIIQCCKNEGIDIIVLGSKNYPYCLSVIDNPPLVLYSKGVLPDFSSTPSISIVGPRAVSDFGKKSAYSLGFRLARAGFTVVSGGAIGADYYAHAGALKAGGATVLVMACGILSRYLPENAELRKAVSQKGCLISEYPPETNTTKYAFPIRNRIISALSLGTVVIEAGEKSGSLITARHAYEQGRDVFVIPGSPDKKEYTGSNKLLRDGAKPLLDASDIFNEYIPLFPDKINIERAYNKPIIEKKISQKYENIKENQKKINESLSKEAKIVYNCINKQKFLPEDIRDTGLSSQQIISALTELEMEFMIKAVPGGMYELC